MYIQNLAEISVILIIFSIILFLFCIAVGVAVLNINSNVKKILSLMEYNQKGKDGENSVSSEP